MRRQPVIGRFGRLIECGRVGELPVGGRLLPVHPLAWRAGLPRPPQQRRGPEGQRAGIRGQQLPVPGGPDSLPAPVPDHRRVDPTMRDDRRLPTGRCATSSAERRTEVRTGACVPTGCRTSPTPPPIPRARPFSTSVMSPASRSSAHRIRHCSVEGSRIRAPGRRLGRRTSADGVRCFVEGITAPNPCVVCPVRSSSPSRAASHDPQPSPSARRRTGHGPPDASLLARRHGPPRAHPRHAPRARRSPISERRSRTEMTMMLATPIAPTSSATAPRPRNRVSSAPLASAWAVSASEGWETLT